MNFTDVIKNLPVGFFVMFGLFIVASVIELIFAFQEKEFQRKIVKPFALLFLSIASFLAIQKPNFIFAALLCGMLGDIFVILPGKKSFPIGVLFFFVGHIMFLCEILCNTLSLNISVPQLIVLIAVFVVIFISSFMLIFRKIADNNVLGLGMSLYFGTLFTVLPAMCIATVGFGRFMFLGIIGSVMFIISDCLLMYCKYGKGIKRHHFYIMLTYLLAQSLIVLSFVLSYTSVML